ncbi:MAG: lamin tail domain-containing protein, partial [Phycisphaerales bacterium]
MTRRTLWSACAVTAGLLTAGAASAQTIITQWNFNSVPNDNNVATGTFVPNVGSGTAACVNIATECIFATADNGSSDPQVGDDSGWQTRGWTAQGVDPLDPAAASVEFAVSTFNFESITISWDQRHSNTSSRFANLYYSTDGGANWTVAPNAPFEGTSGDTWFNNRTVDLSSIPAVNNNPDFRFRITAVFNPADPGLYYGTSANTSAAYATSGTYRFDMVTIRGTPQGQTNPSSVGATASPGAVCAGGGQVTLSVQVQPGLNPDSTGLQVSADLTTIGGAANAPLFDDGTNGDVTAGDNLFTLAYTVPGSVPTGPKTIPITIVDAQSRTGSASIAFEVADCSTNSASRVVISQVYGGGGNAGPPVAIYDADFVELYNRSSMTVDLTGWSVQYASQASVNGFDNPGNRVLLSGVIRPGQYLLVRYSNPGVNGTPLPTPDFSTLPGLGGLGNNGGRVALVRNADLILTNCFDPDIEDFVGYGAAICFEGAAAAGGTQNDTAAIRKLGGAQDFDQNFNDFEVGAPTPRNRAFNGFLAGYGSLDASTVCAGDSVTITVNVSPAASPASTGIQVRADLTEVGGSPVQPLADQGGNVYSVTYSIPGAVPQGAKTIPISVTDAQGRSDASLLSLLTATCTNSSSQVVISYFFGGGGNNGAPWDADHVEIFNRSGVTVDLTGWSLQYAAATSTVGFTAAQTIPLSGSIGPGEYRLIRTANPGANGLPLPTPDFIASPTVSLDNEFGRLALVRTTTPLGLACVRGDVEDFVGYGPTAICFEGVGPTGKISNLLGGFRKQEGCQDTDQNALDFDIINPIRTPRNSSDPANPCVVIPQTGACCCGSACSVTTADACVGAGR